MVIIILIRLVMVSVVFSVLGWCRFLISVVVVSSSVSVGYRMCLEFLGVELCGRVCSGNRYSGVVSISSFVSLLKIICYDYVFVIVFVRGGFISFGISYMFDIVVSICVCVCFVYVVGIIMNGSVVSLLIFSFFIICVVMISGMVGVSVSSLRLMLNSFRFRFVFYVVLCWLVSSFVIIVFSRFVSIKVFDV